MTAKENNALSQLKEEKEHSENLAEKLKGSEQQVQEQIKKEDKHVAELNTYIQEEQKSKIIMNNQQKSTINSLTQELNSSKKELSNKLAM